ncbi:hypothetical protein Daci_3464 [Delftia acidovorans SPH-1]|uniref:Uncharacterized protein n=2 Tax=Comamonadaceae TaxID=80864 RepID=A9C2F6_DELAS|nr:hypothetical protein Daci_3464 [Delftia acidovorans SPH-1]
MAQRPRISHCRCGFRRPTPASFKQVHARHSAAIKWHSVGPANMMCSFEEARRMKIVAALVVALGASSAFSADDPNTAVAAGIVRMSASMNEMALACKHMPSQKVDEAKAKQKSATLSDLKVSEADYEKLYSAAASDFKKKWSSMSAQQQQQSCDQMKKMPTKP